VKIVVDYREKASGLIDLLKNEDIHIQTRKISHGDYIINDSITIERKTSRDFLLSVIDGRLFNQLSNLKKHCPNPIVLIEGNPYQTDLDFDPNAIKGALLSSQVIWYIPIVYSRSKEDSRDILLMIGKQDETHTDVVPLRDGYRPKGLKSRQMYILQGLPKVGPRMANRLLKHFGSVSNVMNATTQDLMKVEGVGEVSAGKIRLVLDTTYEAM
jgi:DNA excision repair protein ERCC-4